LKNSVFCALAAALTILLALSVAADPAAGGPGGKRVVRYSGTSKKGQPISFRLVTKAGKTKVTHLNVDVLTTCWADLDHDGFQDQIVAHITGLHGQLTAEGQVSVYYSPDEDTEYVVEGKLTGTRAHLNVIAGGRFGPDGIPNAGDIDCDNWGTRYTAKRAVK
jgi:hypothetical protein